MNLILHIIRKDFRHLRLYLAGWLVMLIVAPFVGTLEGPLEFFSVVFVGVLKIALLALIVSALVHSDSLVGSTSFWLSRPVSARRLLAAKSFFLASTLIFPTLLVEVLILLLNRVTAQDILRSIPEVLLYTLLPIAILMVLATLTRSLLEMLALGLVSVVAMTVFVFVIAVGGAFFFAGTVPLDPMARVTLQNSKWIGFFSVFHRDGHNHGLRSVFDPTDQAKFNLDIIGIFPLHTRAHAILDMGHRSCDAETRAYYCRFRGVCGADR